MESSTRRPENEGGVGLILQDEVPFDLTKFKQEVRQQDLPLTYYDIK